MASKIKVDSLETADGTGTIALSNQFTGMTSASMPAGSVLQVLSNTFTATTATTSTSFVATGLFIDITPTSTNSKIYVSLSGGGAYNGTAAQTSQYVTIYRDSTNLGHGTYGLSRFSTAGSSWSLAPHSAEVLDSPSSTAVQKYQVYFKNWGTAASVQFNASDRGWPTLTVMEIAG